MRLTDSAVVSILRLLDSVKASFTVVFLPSSYKGMSWRYRAQQQAWWTVSRDKFRDCSNPRRSKKLHIPKVYVKSQNSIKDSR